MLMINFVACVARVLHLHHCAFTALLCFPLALRCHAFLSTLICMLLIPSCLLSCFLCRHDIVCTVHLRLVQPDEPHRYGILRVSHIENFYGLGDPKSSEGASPSAFVVPERLFDKLHYTYISSDSRRHIFKFMCILKVAHCRALRNHASSCICISKTKQKNIIALSCIIVNSCIVMHHRK